MVEVVYPEERPEERMFKAAEGLIEWEAQAIARIGEAYALKFNRTDSAPDNLLQTILSCAREIRDERLELQKRVK